MREIRWWDHGRVVCASESLTIVESAIDGARYAFDTDDQRLRPDWNGDVIMNRQEYWEEIESLAQQVTKEARDDGRDIYDVLHETIDGHQWVIYYRFHAEVLQHTDNDSAMWNEGLNEGINSHDEYMQRAAFCAMLADVREHSDFDAEPEDDDSE